MNEHACTWDLSSQDKLNLGSHVWKPRNSRTTRPPDSQLHLRSSGTVPPHLQRIELREVNFPKSHGHYVSGIELRYKPGMCFQLHIPSATPHDFLLPCQIPSPQPLPVRNLALGSSLGLSQVSDSISNFLIFHKGKNNRTTHLVRLKVRLLKTAATMSGSQ